MIFEDLQVLIFHFDDLYKIKNNSLLFLVIAGLSGTSSNITNILNNFFIPCFSDIQLLCFEFL